MRYIVAGLALMFTVALLMSSGSADAGKEPKHTIKEVMKEAHVKGLLKKVVGGEASAEEKEKLVGLYTDLCLNKPPKGSADEWTDRCKAIIAAAKGVAKGEDGAAKTLAKATNCAACHKLHK
jgi:hypothetical protein